jgi:DNA-binding transcriptional LysR family regulator
MNDINGHKLIGYDRDHKFKQAIKALDWPITDKDFVNKTDFLPLHIELARKGAGITATHKYLVEQFSDLTVILDDIHIPSLEFWIVSHADVQHNRKIRVMMDFLTKSFKSKLAH